MASPQLENGHLKIANELWDRIMLEQFSGAECRVLMVVIRKTYGWNRKESDIPLSEFQSLTGMNRSTITDARKSLLDKNVLSVIKGAGRTHPSTWSVNKNWETWRKLSAPPDRLKKRKEKQTVRYTGQVMSAPPDISSTVHRTVSSCKPLSLFGPEAPKDSLKTIKDSRDAVASLASAQKIRRSEPDTAYELFASEFLEHRGIPYRSQKGDFVQLAGLRKALDCNCKGMPAKWQDAIHNYLGSPSGKYTLADLCSRFDVFLSGKVDRYGKPDTGRCGESDDVRNNDAYWARKFAEAEREEQDES